MDPKRTDLLGKGTRIGKYEIDRVVGVGSMGAVYEAVRTMTGVRVAIKVLAPALAAVPSARARFLEEAKLASRVRHPHIVSAVEVGEDNGRCYLVMERLEGEDLAARLHRSGTLSAPEAADILLPVCDAVAAAHRQGITHRDLKPSNIFLAMREGRRHPVVLDFGIATEDGPGAARDGDGDGADAPAGPALFGTPYYLAPEQIGDHRAAGPASDQYALGVILYECLTGHPPFRGDSLAEVFRAIAAGKPAPPSAGRPEVPKDLDAVVLRALSVDPKARFAWVAAFRRALLPFASGGAHTTPASPRVTPSSPAIDVEAAAPSPFVRTLTPEVEALHGAWFAAGDAQEAANETSVPPSPDDIDASADVDAAADGGATLYGRGDAADGGATLYGRGDAAAGGATLYMRGDAGRDAAAGGWWTRISSRTWITAGGGVVLAGLALMLVFGRAGSSASRRPRGVPPSPPAEVAEVAQVAPPAPAPPAAESPAAAPAAVAAPPVPPPPIPSPPSPPSMAEAPAGEAPATEAPGREATAAEAPAAPRTSRARKAEDRPRTRAGGAGTRMHNGVPLLD